MVSTANKDLSVLSGSVPKLDARVCLQWQLARKFGIGIFKRKMGVSLER